MKLRYTLCLLLLVGTRLSAQQNAMFTQYMFNGLAINPSYSSIDDAINITAIARKQWTGFDGAPSTQSLTFHSPVKFGSKTSVGIMYINDAIGEVISEQGIYGTIAQKIKLADRVMFSAGMNVGITNYKANYSLINDNINPDYTFTDQNDKNLNLGFGMMLYTDIFYAGFSSPFFSYRNISDNNTNATNYVPHFIAQSGIVLDMGEKIKFKPSVLLKYVKGAPLQADLNTNLFIGDIFGIGASWRSMDSFDFLINAQVSRSVQFGYSYDFITTELIRSQRGSHEVMVKFRFTKDQSTNRCYF